jgi:LysR family transcriptional regulator, transcription activator of glutamate synthase operon
VTDSDAEWLSALAPQLRVVVAVLEEEHISRAARRLGVPQPTVSTAIRRINDALGTPIVQPSGRGIIVTAAGHALLPSARRALASLHNSRLDVLNAIGPEHGQVNLGFLPSRGASDVPLLIDAFSSAYPNAKFRLSQGPCEEIIAQLYDLEIDVAILAPLPEDDHLAGIVLDQEKLYLVAPCSHRLAGNQSVKMQDIADEPFVALTRSFGLRRVFDSLCAEAGFQPIVNFEGQDIEILRAFARTALGIAILPRAARPFPGVVEITIDEPKAHREVGAVWLKGRRLAPAAQKFLEFLDTSGRSVLAKHICSTD